MSSGEWLWLSTAGISAQEAVELLNRFVRELVAELRKHGPLKSKIDMTVDFTTSRGTTKSREYLIRGSTRA